MKFGICCSINNKSKILKLQDLGFDYFDVSFKAVVQLSEERFAEALKFIKTIQIPCIGTNCMLKGSYKIASGDYNVKEVDEFLETGFKRVSALGVKYVVFGSGSARSLPKGVSYDEGYKRIVEFTKKIGKMAEAYGIIIAIEPLRKLECNIVNTIYEGIKLAKDSGCKNVKCNADFFHISHSDNIKKLFEFKNEIVYGHISSPTITRGFPKKSKKYDYATFIKALKEVNCKYCSIEGLALFLESASRKSLSLLRELDK
jgi:sugar phosphate isomerase/epimerase